MVDTIFNDTPKGKSGTLISSGIVQNDYLQAYVGVNASTQYNKMRRSDPQIRKILTAINSPIKAAVWTIEPASEESKDLEIAALVDQVIFKDIKLLEKLNEILTFPVHGFSVFEIIHKNVDKKDFGKYTTISNLGFRSQESIIEFDHDESTGEISRVRQYQYGDLGVDAWLDATTLLFFFNEKEGSDNGYPILRTMVGPWKRKQLTETIKMIGIEKFAIPTPTLEVPANISPNDEEYKAAAKILNGFTSAENAYITYPAGWKLDLRQNDGFNPMFLEDSIKREDEKMSGALLASFLELGTGGNGGAYALGDNLENIFLQVIESFASVITNSFNDKIIPSVVNMNYGQEISVYPKLACSGISKKAGEALMRIITGYTNAGVVNKDETLEDYVRNTHRLPKKSEGSAIDNQEIDDGHSDEVKVENINEEEKKVGIEEATKLKDSILLADKTPNMLIDSEAKIIQDAMVYNLEFIGKKLVVDVMNKYKQLPAENKLAAITDITVGGVAKYKRLMKGIFTTTSSRALDQARQEIPEKKNVKLKVNEKIMAEMDKYNLKFVDREFSTLPAHLRRLILLQSDRLVERQVRELEDRVAFSFMQNVQSVDSAMGIEKELSDAVSSYLTSPAVVTGSINSASTLVNQSRNDFFFDPEVQQEIYAYRFNNSDPKSPICKKLAGSVFAKDDSEFMAYTPPLHHNCKSYLSVIKMSAKIKPDIQPLPQLTKADRDSISLSERVVSWEM